VHYKDIGSSVYAVFGSCRLGFLLNKIAFKKIIVQEVREAMQIMTAYDLRIGGSWQITYFDFPIDFCLCVWLVFYEENSVQKIKILIFIFLVFRTAPK